MSTGNGQRAMKRPNSVTYIGIAGLVLGTFGITSSSQGVLVPWFFELWHRWASFMLSKAPQNTEAQDPTAVAEFMRQFAGTMSPALSRLMIAISLIGLVVGGAYLLASVRFLLMRRRSLGLLCWVIVASLIFATARAFILFSAQGMMMLGLLSQTLAGMVFDLVLLVIVLTVGRSANREIAAPSVPPVVGAQE